MIDKLYAQVNIPTVVVPTPTAGFRGTFGDLIGTIILYFIIIGAIVTLIIILYGGFRYVTAGDDSGQAEGARKTITNGVIGLAIIASGFILWQLIVSLLDLNSFFGVA